MEEHLEVTAEWHLPTIPLGEQGERLNPLLTASPSLQHPLTPF